MIFLDDEKNANWAKRTYDLPLVNTVEKYLVHFGITDILKLQVHIAESKANYFWDGVPQKFKDVLTDKEKVATLFSEH